MTTTEIPYQLRKVARSIVQAEYSARYAYASRVVREHLISEPM